MAADMVVRLEQGLWRDGSCFASGRVRALIGEDEALLADLGLAAVPAVRITALVAAACRIDGFGNLTPNDARLLSIGDRERFLIALYRANFGEQLDAVAQCPANACGETVEFELATECLLAPHEKAIEPADGAIPPPLTREVALDTERGTWQVRFRVPNGSDQELAARAALSDTAKAADLVLERCVAEVIDANGQPLTVDDWRPQLREPLSATFSELDAQANMSYALRCPVCDAGFAAVVDAGTFLLRELASRHGIFAEVDQLARAYHWSEAEILALPVARRRRYLAMVAGGG